LLKVDIKRKLPGFSLAAAFSISQEILAILGPSGSGKTMTLQCIAGLLKPDEGNIELNGKVLFDSKKNINLPPQKRNIGFVFQNYALFPHLAVADNIAYGIRHLPSQDIKLRVTQLLEKMHIQALANRYPRQISSGQQQRVALARALAPEPEVLLLDEPFSALDAMRKEQLEFELLELQRSFKGNMLFVTHDLAQGYKLGSRIAVYESGRVIQFDNKANVMAAPASRTVAKLTGFRNLLNCTVVEVADSYVIIKCPELGQDLKVSVKYPLNLAVNRQVTVGVRPEFICLAGSPGENTVSLKVSRIVENVVNITYYFELTNDKNYHLEVLLPKSESLPKDGQTCYLYFPPGHLVIIGR
jgi:molybdate transport system ATP-binding protein